MIKTIKYHEIESFSKDFKTLKKRFRTLDSDLEIVKKNSIELFHLNNIDNHGIVLIPKFNHEKIHIYKIRKFACRALKGKGVQSGVRVIYAKYLEKITFIEIYFKADQENKNKVRIENFLANIVI